MSTALITLAVSSRSIQGITMFGLSRRVEIFRKFIFYGCFIVGLRAKINKNVTLWYYTIAFSCNCLLILGSLVTMINNSNHLTKLLAFIRSLLTLAVVLCYLYDIIDQRNWANLLSEYDEKSANCIDDEEMKITVNLYSRSFILQWLSFVWAIVVCGFVANIFFRNPRDINFYEFLYFYSCGTADGAPLVNICVVKGSYRHILLNDIMEIFITCYQTFVAQTGHLLIIAVFKGAEAKLKLYDDHLSAYIEQVKKMQKSDSNDLLYLATIVKHQQQIFRYM